MNKALKKLEFINHFEPKKCVIIEFPKKELKKELKVPSMGCCKTSMMDWDFSRGW